MIRFPAAQVVAVTVMAFLAAWATVRAPVRAKRPPAPDPLAAVEDADPLELARVVQALGDEAVTRRLEPGQPVEVRLAAIRSTPWMREPELALPSLVRELSGRDPDLAPTAARAAFRIAGSLDVATLLRREVDREELYPVRARLQAAGENELLRLDIRSYAWQAAEMLAAAGVARTEGGFSNDLTPGAGALMDRAGPEKRGFAYSSSARRALSNTAAMRLPKKRRETSGEKSSCTRLNTPGTAR